MMNIKKRCAASSLVYVLIKHCGQTYHVPVIVREVKTNPKQGYSVYFSAVLEGLRQRLDAQSDRHQGMQQKMANPF